MIKPTDCDRLPLSDGQDESSLSVTESTTETHKHFLIDYPFQDSSVLSFFIFLNSVHYLSRTVTKLSAYTLVLNDSFFICKYTPLIRLTLSQLIQLGKYPTLINNRTFISETVNHVFIPSISFLVVFFPKFPFHQSHITTA